MNFFKFPLFFAFMMLLQGTMHAQEWVSYQSQQQVNDLVDIGDELLMATDAGLVVMNKSTLEKTIFNKSNSNLSNNHIQTITIAPNGEAYIGTYDVIMARFDGTDFQDITMPLSDKYDQYTKLYDFKIAPNGDFWLATSDGVFQKQNQDWFHYDGDELGASFFEAWDIEINNEGEVFVASHTIHKYADGEWSNISDTTQLFGYLDADLFFSKSGDLYFAGDLDRIGRFDGNQWQEYENGGLNGSEIKGFTEDSDGKIYFYSLNDGLFKLDDNAWMPYVDMQTEEFNNLTSFFYIDEQNNRWLNSNIYISVNKNGNIESTSISQHNIEYNNVYKIQKGLNGDMFFIMSTSTNSIAVVDPDGNWSALQLPDLSLWSIYGDILFLADDDIWIAAYEGLYHYDGSDWNLTELEPCKSFSIDTQGKIYVLASDRIYIIENNVISEYNVDNSPLSNLIISGLGVDVYDNLWIASFNWDGEAAIQKIAFDGVWTTFSKAEYPAINRPIGDFHFDSEGNIWIPSDLTGAIKFDGTTWTNPITENMSEIENIYVYSIESDVEGRLYLAHQYGVTTFFEGEWGNLSIEDIPNNFSSHGSDIKFDNDGVLWWASSRYGVFSYSTESTTSTFSAGNINAGFSVYPNPVQNYFILDFETIENSNVEVRIYDNIGQLLLSIDLGQLPPGAFQQTINLSDFSTGIYAIQLKVEERFFTKKFFIK